ncbi:MAG: hypothetical protein ACI9TH_003154 [Kiritimatiellia bacterium]|jgi:hypothetical protein
MKEPAEKRLAAFEVSHHYVDDAEVERRRNEWASGEVHGISWQDVKARLGR